MINIDKNILVYENFITDDEQNILLKYAKEANESEWAEIKFNNEIKNEEVVEQLISKVEDIKIKQIDDTTVKPIKQIITVTNEDRISKTEIKEEKEEIIPSISRLADFKSVFEIFIKLIIDARRKNDHERHESYGKTYRQY